MEVWMRRKDRELKDMADIVSIAKRETVCTVAFHDEPCPYLIPLNYGAEVEDGKLILYFHGAKEGTKLDRIRENPNVSYCIYGANVLTINLIQPASLRRVLRVSVETELLVWWKIPRKRKKRWQSS